MERGEDPGETDEDVPQTALEIAEHQQKELILSGGKLKFIEMNRETYEQLEAECAPCTVEEYFDVPIYIIGEAKKLQS